MKHEIKEELLNFYGKLLLKVFGIQKWNRWRIRNGITNLMNIDLSSRNLAGIDFSRTNLFKANFSKSNLDNTIFNDAFLKGANFDEADIYFTNFKNSDLTNVSMKKCYIGFSDFRLCTLKNTDFSESSLDNSNFDNIKAGKVYFFECNIINSSFVNSVSKEMNISKSKIILTDFSHSVLEQCNFNSSQIEKTKFTKSDLSNSQIANSRFHEVNFDLTNLNSIKLISSSFTSTSFVTAINIESIKSNKDVTIDFISLKKSPNLKMSFLIDKLGMPSEFVERIPYYYEKEYLSNYPIFISHSSKDKEFVRTFLKFLSEDNFQIWYDENSMMPGDNILESIKKGVREFDKLILVCSESSLKSSWVQAEVELILEKENELRKSNQAGMPLLVPIIIDDYLLNCENGLCKEIKKRRIADFKDWRNESRLKIIYERLKPALLRRDDDDRPVSIL